MEVKHWNNLNNLEEIDTWFDSSRKKPVLFFKHSTTCGISHAIASSLDTSTDALQQTFDLVYIDLLAHRDVSNQIAERTGVIHQSPQVIIINHGEVIYSASHYGIKPEKILEITF